MWENHHWFQWPSRHHNTLSLGVNRWFDVKHKKNSFGQRSGSKDLVDVVTSVMVLEYDVFGWNSWMMICRRQEATLLRNESYWFQRQRMTWYSNVQGWLSWEWRFMSIAEGWVFTGWLLLNISAKLRWVGSIDPKPKWRYDEPYVWMKHQEYYPT